MLLVAYDIPDDRRRTRVMKALARHGRRVQYSVFLLPSCGPEEIAAELRDMLVPAEDNVRIHPLCATCEKKAVTFGTAAPTASPPGAFRVI